MRTRDFLNRLIARAFVLELLFSLFTYILYQINERFFWLFFASLVMLWWLFVAGCCLIFDLLLNGNDARSQ
ncbi:MAG: hypothetical protein GWN30_05290 [Gammaproteobacteria bacterium]|nr:hypothetical protein [Gammaproteobacteria bacterium]